MAGSASLSTLLSVCIAMTIAQLGLGSYGVLVTKFAKKNQADPLVFSLARDGFSFPVLFLAAYVAERQFFRPKLREFPVLILLGLLAMLSQTSFVLAIYYVSTDIASIFQPMAVIWVCLLSVIMRIEPIPNLKKLYGFAKVFGILLAMVGAVIAAYGRYAKTNNTINSGNKSDVFSYFCLIGSSFFTGIYIVVQKKFIYNNESSRLKCFPVTITAWSYLFAFLFIAITSLYYWNKPEKFLTISNDSVYPLIYAIFITSSMCYMLTAWSNMLVDSSVVSAFWPLQVFFCVLLAYFVLGETLTAIEIIGGVLMIAALFAVIWSNYRENILRNDYISFNDEGLPNMD